MNPPEAPRRRLRISLLWMAAGSATTLLAIALGSVVLYPDRSEPPGVLLPPDLSGLSTLPDESLPTPLDFSRSFGVWKSREFGEGYLGLVRVQVEARILLVQRHAAPEEFFLLAACKSEDTFGKGDLFLIPNYDFTPMLGKGQYRMIREWPNAAARSESRGSISEGLISGVEIHAFAAPKVRRLQTMEEIREATISNRPLTGRTEISFDSGRVIAVMDYPIKTINLELSKSLWQVDTGPLPYPAADPTGQRTLDSLLPVYVAYSSAGRAEFIVKAPTSLVSDIPGFHRRIPLKLVNRELRTNHYSRPTKHAARNTIFALD